MTLCIFKSVTIVPHDLIPQPSFAAASHVPSDAEYRDPNCYSLREPHSFYIIEFFFASFDIIGLKYVPYTFKLERTSDVMG